MKTSTLAWLAAAVIVLGGGAYYYFGGSAGSPASGSQEATSTAQAQDGKVSPTVHGSFSDLAKKNGTWKCTLESDTNGSASSGVVYVSDGNVRGDFSTSVSGYGTVESHMIVNGADVYTWSPLMPQGIKTKMTASGSSSTATSGGGVDANTAYTYDCQPWQADASVFVVPANVTFRAM
jgi:hypothetical protein